MKNSIETPLTRLRDAAVLLLSRRGIRPNHLTLMGLIISSLAALGFSFHKLGLAALLLIIAGAFDVLDGQLARETGQVTRFGAFFDSVVDRYSDAVVFLGIAISYLSSGRGAHALLTMVALVGALITSYSRARGESMMSECSVGYLKRPERVIILIIGPLTRNMDMTIWVLAILSHLTVLQRIFLVKRDIARESSSPSPVSVGAGLKPALLVSSGEIAEPLRPRTPPSFNLIYWDYPRNSWQFYLLSAIILLLILLL